MQSKKFFFLLNIIGSIVGTFSFCNGEKAPDSSQTYQEDPLHDILSHDIIIEPVIFKKPHPIIAFLQERTLIMVLKFFVFKEHCKQWLRKVFESFVVKSYDAPSRE